MPAPTPATHPNLHLAAQHLQAGRLVAFATETVYGLGADACNDQAVASIFAAKGRPSFNPLICHFPDPAAARDHVIWNDQAEALANAFWPGPLTLVLPRQDQSRISRLASAGLDSLAVRVPAQQDALALLAAFGGPIAAPSANLSGRLSPTRADHVAQDLGNKVAMILDSGPCVVGLESTVIGLLDGQALLLRPGGLAIEAIEALVGPLAQIQTSDAPPSPGLLLQHYAPRSPIRLNASAPQSSGEVLLAFGPDWPQGYKTVLNLSQHADLTEAAAHLFDYLHRLDALAPTAIAVMPIPNIGLGLAINDRLKRAAER